MDVIFAKSAYREYEYFKRYNEDKIINKINSLLQDIIGNGPLSGIGKPELLKHYDPKAYSRRITDEHRLVYRIKDNSIYVLSCKGHYQDK